MDKASRRVLTGLRYHEHWCMALVSPYFDRDSSIGPYVPTSDTPHRRARSLMWDLPQIILIHRLMTIQILHINQGGPPVFLRNDVSIQRWSLSRRSDKSSRSTNDSSTTANSRMMKTIKQPQDLSCMDLRCSHNIQVWET